MRGKMTADVYQRGQFVEIGDRRGLHVTTMTRDEAIELYAALGEALGMNTTNVATGNAVVGQQIGHVGMHFTGNFEDSYIERDPTDRDDPRNWRQRGEDGWY